MSKNRSGRVKRSVFTTLTLQLTTLVCGLIVPRVLLGAYGSEAYGATTAIAQFLSYITLLEGGIGGVARAALYKPLADGDTDHISVIVNELKRFFRVIAYISIGYAIILACTFKSFSHIECYDWMTSFWLVLVIAISIFGQYFIGISYSALIQADQRIYILNTLSIITTIINALLIVMLVQLGSDLILVKLVSSIVFLIKPTAMWLYVKKKYGLIQHPVRDKNALSQKWTGLGHHIAYYVHSNTDVAVLTLLDNLKSVSVYSVYHMVTQNIQNVVSALCSGMEPLFGDMIVKGEKDKLGETFSFYETMISIACTVLFSTVFVMIVPFISIYTKGVEDANYIQPLFAYLLTTATVIYCLRLPYIAAITAAGHFTQTKWGAYGEAIINILVSVILVWKFGLIGVAIGTVLAIGFRLVYSVVYLSMHILFRSISSFLKRMIVNAVTIVFSILCCNLFIPNMIMKNYFQWTCSASVVFIVSSIIAFVLNYIFYKKNVKKVIWTVLSKTR